MPLEPAAALNLFVAAVLLLSALTVLVAGRRTPESLLLAVFLGLVGENFLALGLWMQGGDGRGNPLFVVANVVLAWDPWFLLLFATAYPYPRRTPGVKSLLTGVGVAAALGAVLVLTRPAETLAIATGDYGAAEATLLEIRLALGLPHLLFGGTLIVAYVAAWVLAVRAAREAPTPMLARRAAWLALAVGVVAVPRMASVPYDFRLDKLVETALVGAESAAFANTIGWALLLGLPAWVVAYGLGAREARRAPRGHADLRWVVRAVGAAAVLLGAVSLLGLAPGTGVGMTMAYASRWVVFAAILGYGVLAHEVVAFDRAREALFPALGGVLGGFGAAMLALLGLQGLLEDPAALALAAGIGLGAMAPAGIAVRAVIRAWAPTRPGGGGAERRLTLYHAALERAWARGSPDAEARHRLERERRDFRVSAEEAAALEHAVAAALGGRRRRLVPGDEAVPGLVLEGILGEGSQGRVFAATRVPSGEQVVVKEFPATREGQAARHRWLTELEALRGLAHPRIARLLEFHADDGRYLLVMQRVEGRPLADVLAASHPTERQARQWAADVLEALAAAHARGLVHRDVKPSNILIGEDGRAFLTDFGAAASFGGADARRTATAWQARGEPAGTLAYMAPEQARGETVGPTADLYAAGLVLFECLVGHPALDLRGHGLYEALDLVAKPRIDRGAVPPAWRPWLMRALQPDPARRFPTAEAMRRAIPERR